MVILGIDPGNNRLGYSGLSSTELIVYGMIHNPRGAEKFNQHLNASIVRISDEFPIVIDSINPDLIAAETVPVGRLGSNSELVVAAITVCKVIAHQFGIPWKDLGANTVKKEVAGDGLASKAKIKNAVFGYFPALEDAHKNKRKNEKLAGEKVVGIPQDQLDAIAVGIAGLIIYGNKDL